MTDSMPDGERSADQHFSLLVGLGNPGRRYEHTRHNIGFMVLDYLAKRAGAPRWKEEHHAAVCRVTIAGQQLTLAKPLTFMNESGQAVRALSAWQKVPPERILVVSDDLDLPFGRMRLRRSGSSGGHNGLRSISAELGSDAYARLRIGIGRPSAGDPIDWVLSPFDPAEAKDVELICAVAEEMIVHALREGVRSAMNLYNGQGDVRLPAPRPSLLPPDAASNTQKEQRSG
jgi:PTH1 family peptidyl-tRNA hydrolase